MGRRIKREDLPGPPIPITCTDPSLLALAQFHAERKALLRDTREGLMELSLTMAKRIVGNAITTDSATLQSIYEQALGSIPALTPGAVVVHPDSAGLKSLVDAASQLGFEVHEDPSLALSDCVVKAGQITVDARVESALAAFRTAMRQQLP